MTRLRLANFFIWKVFVGATHDIPVLSVSGLVVLHDEHIAAPGHHAGQCDDFFSPVTKFQCRTAREMITLVGWKELIFRPRLKIGLKSVGVHRQSAPLIFCHFNISLLICGRFTPKPL